MMAITARRILDYFRQTAGWAITFVFFLGLIVRLTVKDHFGVVCAIYYAMPPLALAVSAAAAGAYWLWRGQKTMAGGLFAAALFCTAWFYQSCYVSNPRPGNGDAQKSAREEPRVRLLFWNLCRGQLGWEGIVSTIQRHDPDVVALVESSRWGMVNWPMWQKAFPGYSIVFGQQQTLMLCRGRISGLKQHRLTRGNICLTADVETRGGNFKLALVDLASSPTRSRAGRIEQLAEVAKDLNGQPLVMAGDFNLPYDSVHFARFDGCLQNAFRTAGDGYAPTWPMPVPMLQIDHVWTNRHIHITNCLTGWTRYSDHRPIIVDFHYSDFSTRSSDSR